MEINGKIGGFKPVELNLRITSRRELELLYKIFNGGGFKLADYVNEQCDDGSKPAYGEEYQEFCEPIWSTLHNELYGFEDDE